MMLYKFQFMLYPDVWDGFILSLNTSVGYREIQQA